MRVINEHYQETWRINGGVLCFLGGVMAATIGCLITMGLWLIGAQWHPWIRAVDTALFVISIPLILCAGCILDWAERPEKE